MSVPRQRICDSAFVGVVLSVLLSGAASLSAQNVGFVVDNSQSAVHVLNLAQRQVAGTIAVGQHAAEMLILPNNQIAFVSCPDDNDVAVVDLQNQVLVTTIPAGQSPGSLISTSDGRFVFVANEGSNDVTIMDALALTAVATIPVDATPVMVNLSPDGRYLYVVNRDADPMGTVSIIDTLRRQIIGSLSVGLQPVQFALAPNLTTAYVVNTGSNSVSVVDLGSNQVTGQIGVGQGPTSAAFSADGKFMYVMNRDSNSVTAVDITRNAVVGQIPVGLQPVDIAITFDGKFGFVSNQGSNNVTLLDLTARTAELNMPVGVEPFDITLDPNEDFLYVTNLGSQSVSVVDVNLNRVVATIPLGGAPVQFAQYNAPTLLELAPNPAAAGSTLTLSGESLLPSSTVQLVTSAPPRTVTVSPIWLDSQGLQVAVPSMQGSSAVLSVLQPDGNSSEQLTIRFGSSASAVSAGGVVEGAGFQPAPHPVSGGSITSVFGSFPGVLQQGAASFPLPLSLGNARVTFNGAPAPLLFSSSGQINFVTPLNLFGRSIVRVAVTAGNQTSRVETVNVASASPGIFRIPASGLGAFAHGTRPTDLVTTADPALRGESLIAYVTGLGDTFPEAGDGEPAPGDIVSQTVGPVTATVGGLPAHVSFSGLAPGFSGLYQINLDVPSNALQGDQIPVAIIVGTIRSNTVFLAVR